jgi:tryptophan synthase alpha chain
MTPIEEAFARCAAEKRSAFVPFIMAGDPDLATTPRLLEALVAGGADIIELGVPFSDPIADGPVNQRAATRALAAGTHLGDILRMVARHRDRLDVPMVLFTYFNPIHALGIRRFAEQAAASGLDGVLCVDLPPEEAEAEYLPVLREHGLDTVFLLAPTSTKERVRRVAQVTTGFAYYVSRTGVTGERENLPSELRKTVKRLRRRLSVPLVVGFGVSSREQVVEIGKAAEGVVVGSALVRLIEEESGAPDLADKLEAAVRELTGRPKRSEVGAL